MTDRINKILKHYNLNSSNLADKIGVQRSSISHVLSGRNKPSLDFIQKLLKAFPEINSDWIILGKGKMFVGDLEESNLLKTSFKKVVSEPLKAQSEELFESTIEKEHKVTKPDPLKQPVKVNTLNKKTEKIVIFYSDNTFQEFYPENT